MPYPEEALQEFKQQYEPVTRELKELQICCIRACDGIENANVAEHLTHGAGRRLNVLHRAVENIFRIFPPSSTEPLNQDNLVDAQINLHAFLINLVGIFDNWAWCFAHRHALDDVMKNQICVDLFKNEMQRHLPCELREHLVHETTRTWHRQYLKNYRDALAHKIPPYIPPSRISPDNAQRYKDLEAERLLAILSSNWDKLTAIDAEKKTLEHPVFAFLHSFSPAGGPQPILLHPQLLCDAMTVTEFGRKFIQHWHKRA